MLNRFSTKSDLERTSVAAGTVAVPFVSVHSGSKIK